MKAVGYQKSLPVEDANSLIDFETAYARTDWSRFAHLPAFEAANRRNAWNTYVRMQGEPFDTGGNHGNR